MHGRLTPFVGGALVAVLAAACGGPAASQAPGATQVATQAATQPPAATTPPVATAAGPTADPMAFAQQFVGTYTGTWTNTTYGSTGAASVEVSLDRPTSQIAFVITLGGQVFGAATPPTETLRAKVALGKDLTFQSALFGPTSVSVDMTGAAPVIKFLSPDVPSARVATFTATATVQDPRTIEFAYDVTFRDGTPTAHGTATLTRP